MEMKLKGLFTCSIFIAAFLGQFSCQSTLFLPTVSERRNITTGDAEPKVAPSPGAIRSPIVSLPHKRRLVLYIAHDK